MNPPTTIAEPARRTPVLASADVVVVGSGPSGLAAAIGASRAGASVVLVERYGCFGGNMTQVGVEGFAWYRHENTIDSEGVGIEFEQRAVAAVLTVPEPQSDSAAIDAEGFKWVADQLIAENDIEPLLHCTVVGAVVDADTVTGVIVESKSGRHAVLGRRVIDATGDADIAHRAGALTVLTPPETMMAASVMFHMNGVDKAAFLAGVRDDPQTYRDWDGGEWKVETSGKEDTMFSPFLRKPFDLGREAGVIPADLTTIGGTWGAVSDQGDLTYLNLVHLDGVDGTDVRSLTAGEIEGRRQAMMAVEAMRRYVPGCENAKLRNFGMTIGIRDTRKIDAVYNLTAHVFDSRAGSMTRSASSPSSSTATASSSCQRPVGTSRCRTGRCSPRAWRAVGDGPKHRWRPRLTCRRAQHDVLHRLGARRRRRSRTIAA